MRSRPRVPGAAPSAGSAPSPWRSLAIATIVATSSLACNFASAEDGARVGAVVAVRGAVFTEAGGALLPLTVEAPVRERDAIVATNGKARIALDDGTVISVAEHTRVRMGPLTRARNVARTRLALVSGALRVLVAKVSSHGSFEIETETSIAAVRGTDWLIEATDERTAVAVLSGEVAVTAREPSVSRTVVLESPGQGTDVRRGAAPTPPVPWGARRLADLLARATFN